MVPPKQVVADKSLGNTLYTFIVTGRGPEEAVYEEPTDGMDMVKGRASRTVLPKHPVVSSVKTMNALKSLETTERFLWKTL